MLFRIDTKDTQLDYRLRYLPTSRLKQLTKQNILLDSAPIVLRKGAILADLREDATSLLFNRHAWKINWMYNNIPSQTEWCRKSDGFLVSLVLRSFINSRNETEHVVIFSFASPDEIKRAGIEFTEQGA